MGSALDDDDDLFNIDAQAARCLEQMSETERGIWAKKLGIGSTVAAKPPEAQSAQPTDQTPVNQWVPYTKPAAPPACSAPAIRWGRLRSAAPPAAAGDEILIKAHPTMAGFASWMGTYDGQKGNLLTYDPFAGFADVTLLVTGSKVLMFPEDMVYCKS